MMYGTRECSGRLGVLRSLGFCAPPSLLAPLQGLLTQTKPFCDVMPWTLQSGDGSCRLVIKMSKTDPVHHGSVVLLTRIGTSTCPFQAMSKFLAISSTYFPDEPLFRFVNGDFLTRDAPTRTLRSLLSSMHLTLLELELPHQLQQRESPTG